MKWFISMAMVISFGQSFAQPLAFSTLGYEPAYCRLFSFQNGKGQLYCSATGGTPTYTYEWENLETGATSSATTWGNINAGQYKITVTDAALAELVDTVTVDSLNPISDFNALSADLDPIPDGWVGFFHAAVQFENLSQNFSNPLDPGSDTNFWWNYTADWGAWHHKTTTDISEVIDFWAGNYSVALVSQNSNGCTDTLYKTIGIFGPVGTEEIILKDMFRLVPGNEANHLLLSNSFDENLQVNITDLSGKILANVLLEPGQLSLPFGEASGTYVYNARLVANSRQVSKGKFVF